jgi:hypothetical protein
MKVVAPFAVEIAKWPSLKPYCRSAARAFATDHFMWGMSKLQPQTIRIGRQSQQLSLLETENKSSLK